MSKTEKLILELGSGKRPYKPREGEKVIHLDKVNLPDVEVVHDLNIFPYPFEDNTFDVVIATHVLEHLDDLVKVMKEIWRILKPGGVLKVTVPYFASHNAFTDPTHKRFFTYFTFDYFDPTSKIGQELGHEIGEAKFKIVKKRLKFSKPLKPVEIFANIFPKLYEVSVPFLLPALELYVEMVKI